MKLRLAIFDLYDRYPNKGLANIKALIREFSQKEGLDLQFEVFDVRAKQEVPDLNFDFYLATGGPGSPLESEGSDWEAVYFRSLDAILAHNRQPDVVAKPLFMICHSFQLFCRYYRFGEVSARRSESFGLYPVRRTPESAGEPFFEGLPERFWIADFRKFQVLKLNREKLERWGGRLLCLEKKRPHVELEPAIMAIRFNDWVFGTQFHPEAEAEGMLYWFQEEEKKQAIVEEHGQEKYEQMLTHLNDPDKLALTYDTILPAFLRFSTRHILRSYDSAPPKYV